MEQVLKSVPSLRHHDRGRFVRPHPPRSASARLLRRQEVLQVVRERLALESGEELRRGGRIDRHDPVHDLLARQPATRHFRRPARGAGSVEEGRRGDGVGKHGSNSRRRLAATREISETGLEPLYISHWRIRYLR